MMEVGVILGRLWSVCMSGEEPKEPPVPHLGLQMKHTPPPPIPPYHFENSWCVKLNSCGISQDEEYRARIGEYITRKSWKSPT